MTEVLILPTERADVVLRELATEADDAAYFSAINENPDHVDQYGNVVSQKYRTLDDVARGRAEAGNKLRMGIWVLDTFAGTVNATPNSQVSEVELGYWLRESATGNGYATFAVRAMTAHLRGKFSRIFAEVHPDNAASAHVLLRSNFVHTGEAEREWGRALVFEFPSSGGIATSRGKLAQTLETRR